jgi:hypothetical protein
LRRRDGPLDAIRNDEILTEEGSVHVTRQQADSRGRFTQRSTPIVEKLIRL